MIPRLCFFREAESNFCYNKCMLLLEEKKKRSIQTLIIVGSAIVLFGAGAYLLAIITAPAIVTYLPAQQIDVEELSERSPDKNRIVIPKIGVDIEYAQGEAALDQGAEWRFPERGDPVKGGNFILAAHRFELAPTPMGTVRKSPFYHVDKLELGDEIVIDYEGTRYGYRISRVYDVKPTQVEIEAESDTPKLTMYTCTLGGAADGRVVVEAQPVGEVTILPNSAPSS